MDYLLANRRALSIWGLQHETTFVYALLLVSLKEVLYQVHGECSTVITTFRPIPLNWNFAFSGDGETQMVPFFSEKKKLNPLLSGREYLEESDDEDSLGDRRGRRRGKR